MKLIRVVIKILLLISLSLSGVVLMAIFAKKPKADSGEAISQKQKNIRQWWLKKVVRIVGLRLDVVGDLPQKDTAALWVSNHVSWLDIPVVGSEGVAFLSKAEIRQWPVIGWLGKKGGTVFIKRGGKGASEIASKKIAQKIQSGDSVLVFPEATTTDGKDIKRFHARIFAPAIDHGLHIQPIAVRYLDKNGNYHPNVAWGDESFISNLVTILGESSIHVQLTFLPVIKAKDFSERKQLANQAYEQIRFIVKPNATKDQMKVN
jgi:1-acyl-sn-glycerol-3-phosphate acyltransferase